MKALSIAIAITMAVVLSGCSNLRARTCPPQPCLTNPCAVPAECAPVAKAPVAKKAAKAPKTIEK